jgi:tetratricopeptide (TPR) repeat protein
MAATFMKAQVQDISRCVRVQGEISSNSGLPGVLTVELSPRAGGIPETAQVNPDGTFQFDSAYPGMQELRITAAGGAVIHEEYVNIVGPSQRLSVRLPDEPNATRAAGNTVTLQQLEHKVPGAARKAFEKGQNAERKHQLAKAETLLRKAVEEDPEFADAHNELGAVEASQGKLPEAAEEFQKAINVAPEHRLALPNLSIVLAKMRNYREAVQVARRALRVAPQMPELRLILGASLVAEHGDPAEALANLRQADKQFPKAHLLEAQLLAGSGQKAEAAEQLEDYLRATPSTDARRAKIQADLTELRRDTRPKQ